MTTPYYENYVLPIFRNLSSKAKTPKGIISAVLAYRRAKYKPGAKKWPPVPSIYGKMRSQEEIQWREKRRKLTTEERKYRRCLADPEYKKRLIANCQRITEPKKSKLSPLQRRDYQCAKVYQDAKSILARLGKEGRYQLLTPIYIRPDVDQIAKKHKVKVCRRGLKWRVRETIGRTRQEHKSGETHWRNGRPTSYTRAENTTYIFSAGFIDAQGMLQFAFHETEYSLPPAEGYRWAIDTNGIHLESLTDPDADYHPSIRELLRPDAIEYLVRTIQAGAERRRATAIENGVIDIGMGAADITSRITQYEDEGCTVCLRDSLRAGNCRSGTEGWAAQHGLDSSKHYPLSVVLANANGDRHRVTLAVYSAIRRHRREMDRGYADLADHRMR